MYIIIINYYEDTLLFNHIPIIVSNTIIWWVGFYIGCVFYLFSLGFLGYGRVSCRVFKQIWTTRIMNASPDL